MTEKLLRLQDPGRVVAEVEQGEIPALLVHLAALQSALAARLLVAPSGGNGQPEAKDYRLLSIREVAAHLGLPRGRVYELARQGVLPATRIGKYVRVRTDALRDWIARREGNPLERPARTVYSRPPSGRRRDHPTPPRVP